MKPVADVAELERVPEIGLVGAEPQHRLSIGNARKGRLLHAQAAELCEYAVEYGFDRREDLLFVGEGELDVELVELARRAVASCVFVAKTGRNLKVSVYPGYHQELFEDL